MTVYCGEAPDGDFLHAIASQSGGVYLARGEGEKWLAQLPAPRRKTEGKTEGKGTPTPSRGSNIATRPNVFQRLGRFLREVVAELRKVIWPSRNQMVTYTIVVIVFVVFMVALVGVLDLLFAKGVLAVFG